MKLIFIIILICPILRETSSELSDAELWEEARQSLVRRTREYVKENPISNELREFIRRIKSLRKGDKSNSKAKRQDTSNMYAVKDGEVVPVNELSGGGNAELNTESELGANFTVVPLIIPVPLEHNVTITEKPNDDNTNDGDNTEKSHSGILGRGSAVQQNNKKSKNVQCADEEPTTEETVYPLELIEARMKSTSDSSELNQMLDDMEQLINTQKRGRPNKEDTKSVCDKFTANNDLKREIDMCSIENYDPLQDKAQGALCSINGYWDSEAGGKTIHIFNNHSDNDNRTSVAMFAKDPPSEDGFLINEKWNVTAEIPFPHTAEVVLIATSFKARKIAIFIGECRICEGSETITGDWMIGRTSTSCKDQKASHSFFSDILRKNNVPALQNDHFKKINMTTPKPPEDNTKAR